MQKKKKKLNGQSTLLFVTICQKKLLLIFGNKITPFALEAIFQVEKVSYGTWRKKEMSRLYSKVISALVWLK